MLKTRIIPTLLWKGVGLVKGAKFDSWRRVGTVLPAIRVYNTREVDELILVDITATSERRDPDYESIQDFSAECFMPLTVGGGIRTVDHIRHLLKAGADKVAVNTICYENPDLVREASQRFGAQCIVASIDARRQADGTYQCYSHSAAQLQKKDPIQWAVELEALGAGEILITSIDRDGTMEGYDLELTRNVARNVSIPVIASGGAGNYNHLLEALTKGGASAVAAASIFHFTEQTPLEAKKFLAEHGIAVRPSIPSVMEKAS